eukprot:5166452-Ditylum_brightwellii.AAC.1
MQNIVSLSVTDAKTVAGVQCTHNMLYVKRLLKYMDLQVELPIILEIDSSGDINLANNWSPGGRTCHMGKRMTFLCDFKEAGIIEERCLKGDENPVDMFTKNLLGSAFNKVCKCICWGE